MALITEKYLRKLLAQQRLPKEFPLQDGDKLTPSAKDFLFERKISITLCSMRKPKTLMVPVGVSNRHVHLIEEHCKILFGESSLSEFRSLSQPGQFAAKETVTLVGSKGVIQGVRILGPFRKQTQIEISKSDGYRLGVLPPVRLSGAIEGTPGITLVGPSGSVTVKEGLIVAKNHVHMSKEDAKIFDVVDGDSIILAAEERPIIFSKVVVRIKETYQLDFHIDQDEANAAGLTSGDMVRFIGKNHRLFSAFIGEEQDGS